MTETTQTLERIYVIPLRREWRKKASYRRAGAASKAIKKFIARHMKVQDRDLSKVKIDTYLNQEIWFRGKSKPPAKIKVIAKKEKDLVYVSLAEMPEKYKFDKAKHERRHKSLDKPSKIEEKKEVPEEKKESGVEKEKAESEKEKATAEFREAEAKQKVKASKHTIKAKEPSFHRMALQK